ncbi:MAG: malonyl-ACP O-methyltransferase BioC [Candidatus Omnitrophota bacterium]
MKAKELIKRNFCAHAEYYDKYSSIQDICALKLIDKIKMDNFSKILDIGCGTGNYTKILRNRFPNAKIEALDISREMIDIARRKLRFKQIEFIIKDAEAIDSKELFDLITSNASFQWFEDLEKALLKYSSLLIKDGVISFSIFGPGTFTELNASLRELYGQEISITSCKFPEKIRIEEILKRAFKKNIVEEEIFKEEYGCLLELLSKIKYTGIRGNGVLGRSLWTRRGIDKLEEIYRGKFNRIVATYQIYYCQAIK